MSSSKSLDATPWTAKVELAFSFMKYSELSDEDMERIEELCEIFCRGTKDERKNFSKRDWDLFNCALFEVVNNYWPISHAGMG